MKTLLLVLLFSVSASAQDRAYTFSRLALYQGAAFDVITTERALLRPYTREMNPVLGNTRGRRVATVAGLTIATDFITRKLHRDGHTKAARITNFIIGSVHIGAGVWNERQR